jgi:hypothetical protein
MRVLLVEDDPGDVVMIQEGFTEALPGRLDVVGDGDAALAFLHPGGTAARSSQRSRPTTRSSTSRSSC